MVDQEQHQMMIEKLRTAAFKTYGVDGGEAWLNRRSRLFGNKRPIDTASSAEDAREVLNFVSYLTASEDSAQRV